MNLKFISIIVLALMTFNTYAGKLTIVTFPSEADVSVKMIDSNNYKKIGKTPFEMDMNELTKTHVGSEVFQLQLSLNGYYSTETIVTKFDRADLKLTKKLERSDEVKRNQSFDNAINQLFDAQRLIRSKQYANAAEIIKKVESEFSELSLTKELKGSIAYIEKDYKKALEYYKEAFIKNPENLDAFKMVKYLEKNLGVRDGREQQ